MSKQGGEERGATGHTLELPLPLSWPRHHTVRVGIPRLQSYVHILSFTCTQVGGTKGKLIEFSVEAFLYHLQIPHVFKLEISVFRVITFDKRQKDSIRGFCYGLNKAFGIFGL
jgi:hypothetical protein